MVMNREISNSVLIKECPVCTSQKRTEIYNLLLIPEKIEERPYKLNVIKCLDCEHEYQALIWTEDQLKNFYHQDAVYFREDYVNIPESSIKRFNMVLQDIRPYLKSDWIHLDVGGFSGHFSHFMSNYLQESCCIDVSSHLVSSNTRKTKAISNTLFEFSTDIDEARYDFISLNHTLEHMTDLNKVKTALIKLLKPGGYLLIEIPNQSDPNNSIIQYTLDHIHCFSSNSLCRFLGKEFSIKSLKSLRYEASDKIDVGETNIIRVVAQKISGDDVNSMQNKKKKIDKIIKSIEQKIQSSSAVLVWGSGYHTRLLFSLSDIIWNKTIKLIDSDKSRKGRLLFGKEVVHPTCMGWKNDTYVIISSFDNRNEIEETAKKLFPLENIINPYTFDTIMNNSR